jgi:hypothetical protein
MKRLIVPKYKQAEHQEFRTFEEGEAFMRDQCLQCRQHDADYNKTCRINEALRSAMGDNYPMWSQYFVKLTPRDSRASYIGGLIESLKDKIVCRKFAPITRPEPQANTRA